MMLITDAAGVKMAINEAQVSTVKKDGENFRFSFAGGDAVILDTNEAGRVLGELTWMRLQPSDLGGAEC